MACLQGSPGGLLVEQWEGLFVVGVCQLYQGWTGVELAGGYELGYELFVG